MKSIKSACLVVLPLLVLAGCIIGDELTTVTVHPDGSAELVIFRSNLHSTEAGEKADKEVADYKATFDTESDDDRARIREAGGSIITAKWIRAEPPLSNLLHARFPNASALEKFWTVDSEDGHSQIVTRFHSDGRQRKLTFHVTIPVDQSSSPEAVDAQQLQQTQANGISVTRISVTEGAITGARGFIVASDRQSAVLNSTEVSEAIREGQGTAELFLEWEVAP